MTSDRENIVIRYTTDGSTPIASSPTLKGPVTLKESSTLKARTFRGDSPVSDASETRFTKVAPQPSVRVEVQPGLRYNMLKATGTASPTSQQSHRARRASCRLTLDLKKKREHYGLVFSGYIDAPAEGIYSFFLASDDGSRMILDEKVLIGNDGLHGMEQRRGVVALEKGLHPVRIEYFNKTGGEGLSISWKGPGIALEVVPPSAFSHR